MNTWKKMLFFLILLLGLFILSGCGLLQTGVRELEQLQILQAMGLDKAPGGVLVSLAAAADSNGAQPTSYSGTGVSISAALERIRSQSSQEELFCGHLKDLVIGEEAARQGLDGILGYVCRSSDLRLDMPLYILEGREARELLSLADGGMGSVELLQGLQRKQEALFNGQLYTAGRVLRDLERNGAAMTCLLRLEGSAEENEDDAQVPVIAGMAVLQGDRLVGTLDADAALGAAFLTETVGSSELTLQDLHALPVTLAVHRGSTTLRPIWGADGELTGLEINATVTASVLETAAASDTTGEKYADHLTGQLEAAVSQRIGAALRLSRELGADFIGLGSRVEQAAPRKARALPAAFADLLLGMEIRISVRGELIQTGDME